jgi:Tol biopolymer transport system component
MTDRPESRIRASQLFHAALARPSAERFTFLTEACGEDSELRRDVESLMAHASGSTRLPGGQPDDPAAVAIGIAGHSLSGQTVNGLVVGSLLGAGGMGEVYKAHDRRLGRDVAIKVLPTAFSADPGRMRRFEQEARAVARLSHPNVIVVHDVGTHHGSPYVVTELLEGADLRHRLSDGPLTESRAIELATEIADGLAAAHEGGIVHRDIKPENLFVKTDGHLKILDFGLAKLTPLTAPDDDLTRTTSGLDSTEPGMVLGTAGYMSPEQVRGEAVDHRSDVFSFGVVLYEMLSGRRAFSGESVADIISAVLKEEPVPLLTCSPKISPQLDRLVTQCVRKRRDDRYQSTRDLVLALDMIALAIASPAAPGNRARPAPIFRKVTFRRGNLLGARFTPDGQNVVYSAAWDGQPCELYTTRIDGRESRGLAIRDADVLSVSNTGDLALLLKDKFLVTTSGAGPSGEKRGTLAHVPIGGGSPREMLDDVVYADWGPTGDLAIITVDARDLHCHVEYPAGLPRYRARSLAGMRVGPDGRTIALLEDMPTSMSLRLLDGNGAIRTLVQNLGSPTSIAWSPGGDEILYTRPPSPDETALYAVTLDGRKRELYRTDGVMQLCDASRDGRLLLRRQTSRVEMRCLGRDDHEERDRSWLDGTSVAAISDDGRTIAFREVESGGGDRFGTYVTSLDGSQPIRLGDGWAWDLSPDGRWVMTLDMNEPARIVLLPTRAGRPQVVQTGECQPGRGGFITNDRLLFYGTGPDGVRHLYTVRTDSSDLRLVTSDPSDGGVASASGSHLALVMNDRRTYILPLDGGNPALVRGVERDERPIQWSDDGRLLYVRRIGELPAKIYRVNVETGERELWKTLMPADPVGVSSIDSIVVTRNGLYYGYSCHRVSSSELYVVDGLL